MKNGSVNHNLQTIFQELAESSRELICFLDAKGRFVYVNEAYQKVLGYSPGKLIGTRFDNLVHPGRRMLVDADHLEEFECRMRQADGNWRWFSVNSYAVESSPGIVRVLVARDITKQKQASHIAERVLKTTKSEVAQLSQLFNLVDDQVVMWNRKWQYVYANAAALANTRNPEPMLGAVIWERSPRLIGTTFEKRLRAAMENRQPDRFEDRYEPKNLWYELKLYPVETGLMAHITDITELKRVRRTNESVTQMIEKMLQVGSNRPDVRDRSSGAHE